MNLQEFQGTLAEHRDDIVAFRFDAGHALAEHFHITEVGKVSKSFVDCGGTRRSTESCMLQSYVANDFEHRIKADVLLRIFAQAQDLELTPSLPVELEVQADTISIYGLAGGTSEAGKLCFELVPKQTNCLAPESCCLEVVPVETLSEPPSQRSPRDASP